ncbi:glycosyltransferase family 2 protein [Patescibacteria group bacterium]|nr:glycosyltransferase family 2 protein [Patescibacteria group bacterium]
MISAVILTKNNATTLPKILSSLQWCDEIIVIDDYSTDDTIVIAKKQKAHVFQRHLNDDFAGQRNFGMEQAKGEWVLFVDSDEIVSEVLQKEIRETISRQGTDKEGSVGYFLKRDDIFFGKKLKHGETAHVKLMRLAKRNAGIWIRPIHEYWDVRGKTETLNNPLVHSAHPNVAQFIDDINKYTSINAQYLYKNGMRSNVFAIIAYPKVKFFQNYIARLGFLDGTAGFVMAVMMSFHSFLTRAKLYILNHKR